MCISPTRIDGLEVACRYCWQCKANRIHSWVGRAIAEQQYSDQTLAVTLTYAGKDDNPSAVTLIYADFQRFMKRLRKEGYNVRYMVAGEYGTDKGRSHWHAILFFKGKTLKVVDDPDERGPWDVFLERPQFQGKKGGDHLARIQWKPWSGYDQNGYAYFQHTDYSGFQYICKYIQKNVDVQGQQSHFGMSKKPPIGIEYITELAQTYVDHGLAPQTWLYSFPHIFDDKGKRRQFWLSGASRDIFVQEYTRLWEEQKDHPMPYSEIMDDHNDKAVQDEIESNRTDEEYLGAKQQWPKYSDPDYNPDLMNDNPIDIYFVEGTIQGQNYIGIESSDLTTKERALTIYTEKGTTWHAKGEKLRNVQRKGFVTIDHAQPWSKHLGHDERIGKWKEQNGHFPPQYPLQY